MQPTKFIKVSLEPTPRPRTPNPILSRLTSLPLSRKSRLNLPDNPDRNTLLSLRPS